MTERLPGRWANSSLSFFWLPKLHRCHQAGHQSGQRLVFVRALSGSLRCSLFRGEMLGSRFYRTRAQSCYPCATSSLLHTCDNQNWNPIARMQRNRCKCAAHDSAVPAPALPGHSSPSYTRLVAMSVLGSYWTLYGS